MEISGHNTYPHVVRVVVRADCARLHKDFIYTAKTTQVSTRNITNAAHSFGSFHDDCPWDVLDGQSSVASTLTIRTVVRAHHANFHTRADCSRENSTKSEESSFVQRRNHFTDVHHDGTFGITVFDCWKKIESILCISLKISVSILLSMMNTILCLLN